LKIAHWSFSGAWFLEFGVSLFGPGQQAAQTRFLTGFGRVCPGLTGFDRAKVFFNKGG
jgi:hypothetical protein